MKKNSKKFLKYSSLLISILGLVLGLGVSRPLTKSKAYTLNFGSYDFYEDWRLEGFFDEVINNLIDNKGLKFEYDHSSNDLDYYNVYEDDHFITTCNELWIHYLTINVHDTDDNSNDLYDYNLIFEVSIFIWPSGTTNVNIDYSIEEVYLYNYSGDLLDIIDPEKTPLPLIDQANIFSINFGSITDNIENEITYEFGFDYIVSYQGYFSAEDYSTEFNYELYSKEEYDNAYNVGYQDGLENIDESNAYQQGYNEGIAYQKAISGESGKNFFVNIFSGLGDFFSIELFPGISFGLIIGIPFVISIAWVVIRLFRGGGN